MIMEKQNKKYKLGETGFWPVWISKLLFTLISVKVWGLLACTWVSTYLLIQNHIDNSQWLTFNTTIWALIFGMKEIFRIAENRDITEKENLKEQIDSKLKLTSMMSSSPSGANSTFTPDGLEIVGDEADNES